MHRPIVLFTDFGTAGPYVGQMRAVFAMRAPQVPVIELMSDAPAFDPRASAYLLAALLPEMPPDAVVVAVVDPGVGGDRTPMVAQADGRLLVGPDNGLFQPALGRAQDARAWRITWRPQRLSATFHGRDLFAPLGARLALGESPEQAGAEPMAVPMRPGWPDDLAEIVYVDPYGNAMTGLRAGCVPEGTRIAAGTGVMAQAATYSAVPPGTAFWYVNSIGLVELAVAQGRAADVLGLRIGSGIQVVQ
jgi:S-adenosylmethionine hydrolase